MAIECRMGKPRGKGPPRSLSPEEERSIADRYLAGEPGRLIAADMGMPEVKVWRTLSRLGVATPPARAKHHLTPQQEEQVIAECVGGAFVYQAAEKFGVSESTVTRLLRKRKVSLPNGNRPSCTLDETAFDRITPNSSRWVGFLSADGCQPSDTGGQQALSLCIGAKDREHLEQLRGFLGSNHAITDIRNKERVIAKGGKVTKAHKAVFYKVRSKRLTAALTRLGMVKEKALRAPGPELEDLPSFWAGVVDGDGWLGMTKSGNYYYPQVGLCGHMPMLLKFQAFLARRGFDLNITPTESGIFKIGTTGVPAFEIIKLLYTEDSAAAGLARKVKRARQILNGEAVTCYEGPVFIDEDAKEPTQD